MKLKKLAIVGLCLLPLAQSQACTSTKIIAKDNSVVYGRTLEFGIDINSAVIIVPRNYSFTGTSGIDGKGLTWKSKYAAVGINSNGYKLIVEGFNEKGLAVGSFYFPGYAEYQDVSQADANQALSSTELGVWLLTNFQSIDEIKQALPKIKVSKAMFKPFGFTAPLHYIVTEPTGNSLIIEYTAGKLNFFDSPDGIITNGPTYDWHKTNLKNYVNLSPIDVGSVTVNGKTLSQFGEGSGMHGLPGDFTPPSRFVRSAVFTAMAVPAANADQAVQQVFHLLNNFDLPKGSIVAVEGDKSYKEYTLWTSANDLKNKRLYFHTFQNRQLKMIDLNKFNLDAKTIKTIPMGGTTKAVDVSATATDLAK